MNNINYWLLKSEAKVFAIDDLINSPGQRTLWDGVRNHQARNYLGQMRPGDLAFSTIPTAGPRPSSEWYGSAARRRWRRKNGWRCRWNSSRNSPCRWL